MVSVRDLQPRVPSKPQNNPRISFERMKEIFGLATNCAIGRYVIETKKEAKEITKRSINGAVAKRGALQVSREDTEKLDRIIDGGTALASQLEKEVEGNEKQLSEKKREIAGQLISAKELNCFNKSLHRLFWVCMWSKASLYFFQGAVMGGMLTAAAQGVMKITGLVDFTALQFAKVSLTIGMFTGMLLTTFFYFSMGMREFTKSFRQHLSRDAQEIREYVLKSGNSGDS